mmetsp:Transcript_29844/g.85420  ORF Transcript_29844/g.85420 Transcript_29844/m.85420 type:complete len:284 (+) Transcript_29844:965-1816(+)
MLAGKSLVVEITQHDEETVVGGNVELGELKQPVSEEQHACTGKGDEGGTEDHQEVPNIDECQREGVRHCRQPRLRHEYLEEATRNEEGVPANEDPVGLQEACQTVDFSVQAGNAGAVCFLLALRSELPSVLLLWLVHGHVHCQILDLPQEADEHIPAAHDRYATQHAQPFDPHPEVYHVLPQLLEEDGIQETATTAQQGMQPQDHEQDVKLEDAGVAIRSCNVGADPQIWNYLTIRWEVHVDEKVRVDGKIRIDYECLDAHPRCSGVDPLQLLQADQSIQGFL